MNFEILRFRNLGICENHKIAKSRNHKLPSYFLPRYIKPLIYFYYNLNL
jgi:hypothetical protein